MAAKSLTSQLHLKLELMHNVTCRTSRLETRGPQKLMEINFYKYQLKNELYH